MAYIVVGLGNPGKEYEATRHNTGQLIVDAISPTFEGGAKFVVLDTFMNNSGKGVAKLVKSQKAAEKLVVIHDDLDLPLGRFKISFDRSSGGHRGVESIIKTLKTQKFIRIKVGIGGKRKPTDVVKFIIGKFKPAELAVIKKEAKKIGEALEVLVADGRDKAMTLYNSS